MEVELKFLLSPQRIEQFEHVIETCPFAVEVQSEKQLRNAYYDTPDLILRRFDIGFRSRQCQFVEGGGYFEQTVKLAGQDLGGLHQRPEYNLRFDDYQTPRFPDLTKFDPNIWPDGFDATQIQSQLSEMFATDFCRKTWLVTLWDETQVECVLDRGEVLAGEASSPICEVELELVKGNVSEMFQLAKFISANVEVRLGSQSKAARGYLLAGNTELKSSNLDSAELAVDVTVEDALVKLVGQGLKYLQHNEIVFHHNNSPKALRRVIDGVSMLGHVMGLFANIIHSDSFAQFQKRFKNIRKELSWVDAFYQLQQLNNRQSPYRKDIEKNAYLTELLAKHRMPIEKTEEAKRLLSSAEFNLLMLEFIQWSTAKQWRNDLVLSDLEVLSERLNQYSSTWLSDAWQDLKEQLNALKDKDNDKEQLFERLYWPLATGLMTGVCVGSLYDNDDWQSFRNPLLDFLVGCEELMLLSTLKNLLQSQSEEELNHIQWVDGKRASLETALRASVSTLKKLRHYW